jgi:hypothetical protein
VLPTVTSQWPSLPHDSAGDRLRQDDGRRTIRELRSFRCSPTGPRVATGGWWRDAVAPLGPTTVNKTGCPSTPKPRRSSASISAVPPNLKVPNADADGVIQWQRRTQSVMFARSTIGRPGGGRVRWVGAISAVAGPAGRRPADLPIIDQHTGELLAYALQTQSIPDARAAPTTSSSTKSGPDANLAMRQAGSARAILTCEQPVRLRRSGRQGKHPTGPSGRLPRQPWLPGQWSRPRNGSRCRVA